MPTIKFISSKDSNKIRIMHTKSDNIKIMMDSEKNDINDELFKSRLQNYHEFVFDSVDSLYYHLQKISLKRSNVNSPKWLKDKK